MTIKLKFDESGIKVYKGDNLEVLKCLESNSIDLIYCDILYNSGKTFADYDDNLGSAQEAVEWYRPRLKEMHRVLKENGSIYLHCNWRIDSYIRVLLDEIFGYYNFRNRIYRQHSGARGFVENYDSQVDVILYYTKDRYNFTFNEIQGNKLRIVPLVENGYCEALSFEFRYKEFYFNPKDQNKHWLIPRKKIEELYDKGQLEMIDGMPYRKTYSIPVGNLWSGEDMLDPYSRTDISEGYDTPKPSSVLKRIIEVSSNKGDVVADLFMGGGTTPLEVLKAGRKGVFCDISEKACKVSIGKLKEELAKRDNQ
ncbi:MAG: DNA methyltransferase [Ignavibacteriales bacterium]